MAHAGYAARGGIYLFVAWSAAAAAWGSGNAKGSKDALHAIGGTTIGNVIVGAIGVGLVGYAAWRGTQALLDADNHGTGAKGLCIRAGLGISAITHTGLALWALLYLIGVARSDDGDSAKDWTAWLMGKTFGHWLVAVAGLVIAGAGVAQVAKGWMEGFDKYLRMAGPMKRWAYPIARIGLIARGLVFVMLGGFVVYAAWRSDASEARGLGEGLSELRGQPFGPWLLGAVAVGLFAFSVYSFIEARWRKVYLRG